ncbi:hypothetical protein F5884DRAFT_789721 [Xylogone sp. PMI_703]|nr:hypothetical protein F5884DRAFT_789721 [Xylogone sp. PMI_703]
MASRQPANPPPKPAAPETPPGERLANYFDNFFKTIVAIATLGSSLTFSKIIQTPVQPWHDYGFDKLTVQYYLANSWLFFILDLAITSFAASALSMWRPSAVAYFGTRNTKKRRKVLWYATLVTSVLFGLLIAAFTFLSLTIAAYVGPTGWIAVGAVTFFGMLGFGTILYQSPIGSHFDDDESDDDVGGPGKGLLGHGYYPTPNTPSKRYDDEKNAHWSTGSPIAPIYTGGRRPSRHNRPPMHLPRYSESGYDLRAEQMLHQRLNRIHAVEDIMAGERTEVIETTGEIYYDDDVFSSPIQMDDRNDRIRR